MFTLSKKGFAPFFGPPDLAGECLFWAVHLQFLDSLRRQVDAASAIAPRWLTWCTRSRPACRPRAYCSEITTVDCVCAPATDA